MWPSCPFFDEEKDEEEDEDQLNWERELEDRLLMEFPQEEQEVGEEEESETSAEDRIGTEISERFDRDESNLTMIMVNIVWEFIKLIRTEIMKLTSTLILTSFFSFLSGASGWTPDSSADSRCWSQASRRACSATKASQASDGEQRSSISKVSSHQLRHSAEAPALLVQVLQCLWVLGSCQG